MKRETPRHPKTYDLMARLQCARPTALGYLELLWHFTAEVSIDGSVGRWPDGAIARACDWNEEPSDFVNALVAAGWLDRDPTHRLLVHDWEEHCQRWVKLKLTKLGQEFAKPTCLPSKEPSIERSIERTAESTIERSPPRDQTKPNLTKLRSGRPGDRPPFPVFAKALHAVT